MKRKARALAAIGVLLVLAACAPQPAAPALPPMLLLDGVLYYDSGVEETPETQPEADGQIVSSVESTQQPTQQGQSNFGCVGSAYSLQAGSVLVERDGRWTWFVKPELTLEAVKELSKKGEALSWEDFTPYRSMETGSGLYILVYEISSGYQLYIGGMRPDEPPAYIRLTRAGDPDTYIDVRTGDVESFLAG